MKRRQVVSALAVALAAACGGDDDEPAAPSATTETAAPTSPTSAPDATESSGAPPTVSEAFPPLAVVVFVDGRIALVDTSDGTVVRELGERLSDLLTPEPEGGHRTAVDIDVAPDGSRAFLDICCEPAAGRIDAVDLTTGDSSPLGMGYHPAVSPDRTLAYATYGGGLAVVADGQTRVLPAGARTSTGEPAQSAIPALGSLAWVDSTTLVAIERDEATDASGVVVIDTGSVDLSTARALVTSPDRMVQLAVRADGSVVWAHDDGSAHVVDVATGNEVAAFELGAAVDVDYDASGTWLLIVDSDGSLRWQGAGQSGAIAVEGVQAAGW